MKTNLQEQKAGKEENRETTKPGTCGSRKENCYPNCTVRDAADGQLTLAISPHSYKYDL